MLSARRCPPRTPVRLPRRRARGSASLPPLAAAGGAPRAIDEPVQSRDEGDSRIERFCAHAHPAGAVYVEAAWAGRASDICQRCWQRGRQASLSQELRGSRENAKADNYAAAPRWHPFLNPSELVFLFSQLCLLRLKPRSSYHIGKQAHTHPFSRIQTICQWVVDTDTIFNFSCLTDLGRKHLVATCHRSRVRTSRIPRTTGECALPKGVGRRPVRLRGVRVDRSPRVRGSE